MSDSRKRLMILGAGPNQVPAIRKASELSLYVITVDYLPHNVGHRYSHQYINCSTVDKAAVMEAAAEFKIDGIMTLASDVATPTVGYVAERLGLAGYASKVAETMSNKARFRENQRRHGWNHPRFIVATRPEHLISGIGELTPPLMFKPVDTSGSRGISRVDAVNYEECLRAFEYAVAFSRSRTVCVEEFVEGVEVGGDGFVIDGEIACAVITHKHKCGYIVTGHSLPTNIGDQDQARIVGEIARNCQGVGYTDGPLNFDVMVSSDGVTVLEMSPRLGGNGIPLLVEHGTSIDLIEASVRTAVGEKVAFVTKVRVQRPSGSWVFGSDKAGIVEHIASEEEVRAAVPALLEYSVSCQKGDKVPSFIHNGNSLGYMLFDCISGTTYQEMVARLQDALQLRVS